MGVKRTYRGIPQQDLATFDWLDLATGTGYKTMYPMDTIEGTDSRIYVITTQELYSNDGFTDFTNTAGEINFNLAIEVPLIIDGIVVVNAPVSSAQQINNFDLTFKLFRVTAASTEVQLGSTVQVDMSVDNSSAIASVRFDVPVTTLKAGETLRLECVNTSAGAAKTLRWMHDPKARNVATGANNFVTSQMIINLPIKL